MLSYITWEYRGPRPRRTKELDNQATSQPENQGKQTSQDQKNPETKGRERE